MVSKGGRSHVLWPHYFDARRSRAEGRRVSEAVAVKGPDLAWMVTACERERLEFESEEDARHPSIPYQKSGRVLVDKAGPKQALVERVGRRMRESQDRRGA